MGVRGRKCISNLKIMKILVRYANLVSILLLLLLTTACTKDSVPSNDSCFPVTRDTDSIVLVQEGSLTVGNNSWELDFYRNLKYHCGLSGNYTFLVVEPRNNPGSEAPLWIHLHGGAHGYFDNQGEYHTRINQDQDSWNHEEPFEDLRKISLHPLVDKNGLFVDNTLTRKLKEGYRLLVVSYCDHDLYSGLGTPYPNNPKGGEVNGLQATMAAVEYTAGNYSTTHVFAHGTSAGSVGAYALAFAFAREGTSLSGIIMDSGIPTPRGRKIYDAYCGKPGFPMPADFEPKGIIEKVGVLLDMEFPYHPEAAVKDGFRITTDALKI